jgi:hypothetical protein
LFAIRGCRPKQDFREVILDGDRKAESWIMDRIEAHLWVAAVLQWLIAASNLVAARIFAYRDEIAKLSPFVREVFIVQNIYIMVTVAMFGSASILFASELAGGSALGRFLSGFLALFWGGRIVIQLFFYDRAVKRSRPIANLLFLSAFLYLCGVFAVACLRPNP